MPHRRDAARLRRDRRYDRCFSRGCRFHQASLVFSRMNRRCPAYHLIMSGWRNRRGRPCADAPIPHHGYLTSADKIRVLPGALLMASLEDVVIVSAVRTPIGKFQGALSDLSATDLGAIVVREAVTRAGITDLNHVNECIMGNVLQAGLGQNPARQAAIKGGLPPQVGAMTINKVCGSGLKSVALAAQAIQTGNAEVVVAGGMESMTNAPYLMPAAREGFRMGNNVVVDSMINDGLWDVYKGFHMGQTGENVADKFKVTREQQDEYAANSHRKAVAAQKEGRFKDEIVPVQLPSKKKDAPAEFLDRDEGPREDSTPEVLRKLKPAFKKDGTVTAGNASTVNDGAAALVVTSATKARELGLRPMARI